MLIPTSQILPVSPVLSSLSSFIFFCCSYTIFWYVYSPITYKFPVQFCQNSTFLFLSSSRPGSLLKSSFLILSNIVQSWKLHWKFDSACWILFRFLYASIQISLLYSTAVSLNRFLFFFLTEFLKVFWIVPHIG